MVKAEDQMHNFANLWILALALNFGKSPIELDIHHYTNTTRTKINGTYYIYYGLWIKNKIHLFHVPIYNITFRTKSFMILVMTT